MRSGGLSTSGKFFLTKIFEDLKIYKVRNLSILDYLKKIISKVNQFLISKHIKLTSYHKDVNAHSKVKFIKPNQILEKKGKVISALNLAYIAYNYKYNLRQHNHVYWPDGIFSTYATNKIKEPSRVYFTKLITHLNKDNKYKLHIFGNIPDTTHHWLNKKLSTSYIHHKLPYGNIKKIIKSVNGLKLKKNKIIILTLPTPKQEQLANFFSKKFPANNLICIGGGLNILSGYEEKAPKFFYDLNLEWLWRLKFDSYRRFKRLLESVILYLNIIIRGKNNIF
jgi:exopolysaccharide biosynthesis WecB/TagA/CpsF family protein